MGIDNCCDCAPGTCTRIQCNAVVPLTGYSPFPAWAQGSASYTHGDGAPARTAFLNVCERAFAVTSTLHPLSGAGLGIASLPDNDNETTRYRSVGASWTSYFMDDVTGLPATYDLGFSLAVHPLSHFTGIGIAAQNAQSYSAVLTSSSPNIATGNAVALAISDDGTLTDNADPIDLTPPNLIFGDWLALVDTYTGCSALVTIGATTATLVISLTEAAAEDLLSTDVTGSIELTAGLTLSGAYGVEDQLAVAESLLDNLDLTDLTILYPDQGFNDVLKFGHRYLIRYEGPTDGEALRVVLDETATGDNTPYAAREWIGIGSIGVPAPYDFLTFVSLFVDGGVMRVAKARGPRLSAAATLYSEDWTIPVVGSDESLTGQSPGAYGGVTDCILWNHAQADFVDLADLIFGYGRATIQRTCASDTLCTP